MSSVRQKLTVLIPCKDEHRDIRDCIESVRSIADEILVADSGSTDGTLEIVRRAGGCRLIEHAWTGYSSFKNWAMSQARHSWILILDADERVTPELAEEINRVLSNPPDQIDAYSISFRTYFMGRLLRFSSWNNSAIRLVRNGCGRYVERRVHERMEVDRHRTAHLRGKLLHYSYWSYDEYFEKYVRYSKLSAEELWDRGKRAGIFDLLIRPFLRFFHLYLLRGGFLDGLAGIQICMLTAFFYSFAKQARLWEMAAVDRDAGVRYGADSYPDVLPVPLGLLETDRVRAAA